MENRSFDSGASDCFSYIYLRLFIFLSNRAREGSPKALVLSILIKMPLRIAAIVCTLFADRIDMVVKGDTKS